MKLLLENHGKFNSSLCGNNPGVQEQHSQRLVSDIQIVINELAGAMAPTVTRKEKTVAKVQQQSMTIIMSVYVSASVSICVSLLCHIVPQ